MAEISVIVPVYKVELYLNRCVKSILSQTFTDFELILIDDGSPDSCPQMCDEWAKSDRRIKVIHKENGGLSSARNRGLEVYKGNYVFFVDSDDWIEKDALNVLYQIAICSNADIVVGKYCEDKHFNLCNQKCDRENSTYKIYDRNAYLDMYLKITEQSTRYHAWAKLYSRKVAAAICYPEGYTSEDVAGTFYAIANSEYIAETDYIIYHYFINESGITRSPLNRTYLDMYYSWNKVIEYSQNNLPEYLEKCVYNLARIDLPVLLAFIVRPINGDYKEYLTDLRIIKHRLNKNYTKIMRGSLSGTKKIVLTLCRIIPTEVFCIIAKINYDRSIT